MAILIFTVLIAFAGTALPLFSLAWFVITIAPYIRCCASRLRLLPDRADDRLGDAWRLGSRRRVAAGIAARALALIAVVLRNPWRWQARYMTRLNADNSRRVRTLVMGWQRPTSFTRPKSSCSRESMIASSGAGCMIVLTSHSGGPVCI